MPAGRPTKLTEEFLAAVKSVIDEDQNVLVCTDDELLMLINKRLPEESRISERSFQLWKAGDFSENSDGIEFLRLIKEALVKEKKSLMTMLKTDEKAWQRWAWIIERKFDEWNIKMKTDMEVSGKEGAPPLTVTIKKA